MLNRRLINGVIIAVGLPIALFGLLLPTPSLALSASAMSIQSFDYASCIISVQYTRTPTINDGGSGSDYFLLVVKDSTGQVDARIDYGASMTSGTQTYTKALQLSVPANGSTSLTASIYETTTYPTGAIGALLASSPAYNLATMPTCAGGGSVGVNPTTGITYYPPDNRSLALILVNTPIFTLADPTSQTIGTLQAGQTWFVTARDSTGQFWQIFLGGPNLGWVKASDVSVPNQSILGISNTGSGNDSTGDTGSTTGSISSGGISQSGIQSVPPGTVVGIIDSSRLNLHLTGNILSPIVGTASAGDRYLVLGHLNPLATWVKVSGPAGTGWVNSYYMILSAPLHDVPVISG